VHANFMLPMIGRAAACILVGHVAGCGGVGFTLNVGGDAAFTADAGAGPDSGSGGDGSGIAANAGDDESDAGVGPGVIAYTGNANPGDQEAGTPGQRPPATGGTDSSQASVSAMTATCAADGGVCVIGGIFSGARVPANADAGAGAAAVTDDGFELGVTSCDSTGITCVTGGIAP